MGAQTGNMSDPRQRQLAREGIRMRQENIRQRGGGNQAGPAPMVPGLEPSPSGAAQQEQAAAGISFGPGRAMRMPDVNSPEYQMIVDRMRRGRR